MQSRADEHETANSGRSVPDARRTTGRMENVVGRAAAYTERQDRPLTTTLRIGHTRKPAPDGSGATRGPSRQLACDQHADDIEQTGSDQHKRHVSSLFFARGPSALGRRIAGAAMVAEVDPPHQADNACRSLFRDSGSSRRWAAARTYPLILTAHPC